MDMLSKTTLVIPTYNRHPFLLRFLQFYSLYDYKFEFLILDSSSDKITNNVLLDYIKKDNVEYKKYNQEIFIVDKIANGVGYIDTPFAVLCADDDFIIPTGIVESQNFLLENKNYVSAHGLYFNHTSADDVQKKGFTIVPLYQKGGSSEQDSATKRLNAYLSGPISNVFYAVHRTELLQLIWTETKTFVSDWGLAELFPCSLSFIYGKMKVLPIFYSSREPNTFATNNYGFFKRNFSESKVNKAIKGVAKHLEKIDGMSIVETDKISRIAFENYLNRSGNKMKKLESTDNNNINYLITKFRQELRIRNRFQKWFYNGCHPSIYPKYFEDFKKIKDVVLSANLTQEKLNFSRKNYAEQGDHYSN